MIDKNSYIRQWLELAEGDLLSARHLLTLYPHKLEVICYLCEQSSEKMLKGFLAPKLEEIPRVHDLMKLCRMCMEYDKEFEELFEPASRLMPYGVQVRYPNNTELLEEDMQLALNDAQKIMDVIEPKIQMMLAEEEQAESSTEEQSQSM